MPGLACLRSSAWWKSLSASERDVIPDAVTVGNSKLIADKREFSTGSFGWYYNGKTTVTVDGKPLSVQIGLNLTVVGSKEAER